MNTNVSLTADDRFMLAGYRIMDLTGFTELLLHFVVNFIVILLLVRWLYYSMARRKEYLFTYVLISTIVFLLCFLLENVKLEIGFALGLFAIFGILRYRTDTIPIKEMTYLFLVIGISVINALASNKISIAELFLSNFIILLIAFCYEKMWLLKPESAKTVVYDKVNLIVPEKHVELLDDLKQRTGISKIKRVEVDRIDFVRDICQLTIYYEGEGGAINLMDNREPADSDDDD